MWPSSVVKIEVVTYSSSRVRNRVIGVKINFFVFDRSPQSFNEHLITPSAFAIHADLDAMVLEQASKGQRSKLTSLFRDS